MNYHPPFMPHEVDAHPDGARIAATIAWAAGCERDLSDMAEAEGLRERIEELEQERDDAQSEADGYRDERDAANQNQLDAERDRDDLAKQLKEAEAECDAALVVVQSFAQAARGVLIAFSKPDSPEVRVEARNALAALREVYDAEAKVPA